MDLLEKHFSGLELDIRKKPNGYSRFMDQKITPDVLSFIADCIVNYLGDKDPRTEFTVKTIWDFPYFIKNTIAVFGKPSPNNKTATAEYDKFIAQPLKTLAFSGVLKEKSGRPNIYSVINQELLEYISQNERNAWSFIVEYVKKILTDSGFIDKFETYKNKFKNNKLKKSDFVSLKKDFQSFMRGYTNINGNTEINRIFPKILNPYASYYQIPGTEKGHMTKVRFIYPDLMYNRENFRDIKKDKISSRQEALREFKKLPELVTYRVQKAKNIIRRYHLSSEVKDSLANGSATQVHHIFPDNEFPEISDYVENLVLLTPQQHNIRAHPNNKTQVIDPEYQRECLLFKIETVKLFGKKSNSPYSKERLIHVINIGYGLELPTTISLDELKKMVAKQ